MKFFFKKTIYVLLVILILLLPKTPLFKNIAFAQAGSVITQSTATNTAAASSLLSQQTNTSTPTTGDEYNVGYLNCEWYDLACHGVNFIQLIVMLVGNVLVGIAGLFLDFFLQHSISSSSYRDAEFISQGWEILRDITNIVFIFALLTVAFKMVVGQNDGGTKQQLVKTILIALVINFSLFASLLLIDVGNLLAYTFYNKIDTPVVTYTGATAGDDSVEGIGTVNSVSLAIANRFDPQTLLNQSGTKNTENKGQRMVIVIMIGIINAVVIYTFISVAFLFLGRTVGLYISTMLSALAFATLTVPGARSFPYIGFDKWLSEHIKMVFMAPVFLFFLYMSIQFMNIALFVPSQELEGQFIQNILAILVPMASIISIILLAKKVATDMAGQLGTQISGFATKALGGAVALSSIAATGGAAALGGASRLVGAAAKATGFEKTAGRLSGVGKTLQATNFNFAQTKLGKFASKQTGINMGENLGNLSYARADTAARSAANSARTGYDNFATGKTPESVQAWQNNIDKSRDELRESRKKNQETIAEEKATGTINTPTGPVVVARGEANDRLEELQTQQAQQTTSDKKREKDTVKNEKDRIQSIINAETDVLNKTNSEISELTKKIDNYAKTTTELTGKVTLASTKRANIGTEISEVMAQGVNADPDKENDRQLKLSKLRREHTLAGADVTNAQTELNSHTSRNSTQLGADRDLKKRARDASMRVIEKEKKDQSEVEEKFTLEGQVKQIKKIIDNKKQDRVAAMFNRDINTRFTTQDSNLTPGDSLRTGLAGLVGTSTANAIIPETREDRARTQAARSASGQNSNSTGGTTPRT